MNLSNTMKIKGIKRNSKRVGRGIGSGKGGHTVGKGTKGQKARKGHKFTLGFEGGQVPLYKRLPQLGGFRSFSAKDIAIVNLDTLNVFEEGTEVNINLLLKKGILHKTPKDGVKILGRGNLEKKLTLKGFLFSENAREKAEKSGAKINE